LALRPVTAGYTIQFGLVLSKLGRGELPSNRRTVSYSPGRYVSPYPVEGDAANDATFRKPSSRQLLRFRFPIMVLLLAHAASIPVHIPVAGAWKHPDPADVDLITFMIFEAAFVSMCRHTCLVAFLRTELQRVTSGLR
jgi:hypothetical protein